MITLRAGTCLSLAQSAAGGTLILSYVWPIALIVLSNTLYQICAKSVPQGMNPFASLTVTYLVAAAVSGILYYAFGTGHELLKEYGKLPSWTGL